MSVILYRRQACTPVLVLLVLQAFRFPDQGRNKTKTSIAAQLREQSAGVYKCRMTHVRVDTFLPAEDKREHKNKRPPLSWEASTRLEYPAAGSPVGYS